MNMTWRSNILPQRKSAVYAYCTLISHEVIDHIISFYILLPIICSSSNASTDRSCLYLTLHNIFAVDFIISLLTHDEE